MKKPYLLLLFAIFITSLLINPFNSSGQANVNSTTGYSVGIFVMPVSIIPSSTTCPYGFNYNVRMNYSVTFSGTNIPASLYTLQGYLRCGPSNNFFDLPNNGGVGTVTSTSNPYISSATCNSASVNSLNCNTARIDINGPGISARTVTIPITYVALPVHLTSFDADVSGKKVTLSWETASEANSKNYIVERSRNGIEWTQLTTINAAGQSDSIRQYQWVDVQPLAGISYYRLRLTDIDSRSSYSDIKSVQFNDGKTGLSIYPVPSSGNTIHVAGMTDPSQYRVSVINNCGEIVYSDKLSSPTIEIPGLRAGLYVVSFQDNSGATQNLRYVKL